MTSDRLRERLSEALGREIQALDSSLVVPILEEVERRGWAVNLDCGQRSAWQAVIYRGLEMAPFYQAPTLGLALAKAFVGVIDTLTEDEPDAAIRASTVEGDPKP